MDEQDLEEAFERFDKRETARAQAGDMLSFLEELKAKAPPEQKQALEDLLQQQVASMKRLKL